MHPRPPLIVRLRPRQWLLLDSLGGGLYGLAAGTLFAHRAHSIPAVVLGVLLASAAVGLARSHPTAGFAAAFGAFWLTPIADPVGFIALLPMAWALYVVAARSRSRLAWTALGLALTCPLSTVLAPGHGRGAIFPFELVLITAWSIGYAVGQRQRYHQTLARDHARKIEVELEQARQGVVEERIRIARELHDSLAHSVSVITVQAAFGRLVMDSQPAQASKALAAIEVIGRDTLGELRRLLGVLREDGQPVDAPLAPAPGLADVDKLLERTAMAGVEVQVTVTGTPRELPAGIELTAYRVLQESLTNVIKHAESASAFACIQYLPDELLVKVVDHGRGAATRQPAGNDDDLAGHSNSWHSNSGHCNAGRGIAGMRERVNLYGGSLLTATLPAGGFEVTARVPTARPADWIAQAASTG